MFDARRNTHDARRVAFATLGCKANWCDTEMLSDACRRAGLSIVQFDEEAHAYVVNTCTVTAIADRQSKQMLRRAVRNNPKALVVATGCCGEVDRAALERMHGVDAVFGTADRADLVAYLSSRLGVDSAAGGLDAPTSQSRARAFLKIQDGCDRRCAYCIVPRARGRSKSVHPDDVIRACKQLSKNHHEIILSGTDIGQYGGDPNAGMDLSRLLEQIVSVEGISRIRLSTLNPLQIDERLMDLMAIPGRLCRHVHLSIQSGADAVLRRMARGYRAGDIKRAVRDMSSRVGGVAITGDIIAGFPGETQRDHLATLELISSMPIAGLHVFPYSRRPGTVATEFDDQVPAEVKHRRASELRALARRLRRRFLASFVGGSLDVIVTSRIPDDGGCVKAFSDNAISVGLLGGVVRYGGLGRCVITDVTDLEVKGQWKSVRRTNDASKNLRGCWAIASAAGST